MITPQTMPSTHPPDEMLAAFAEGRLSGTDRSSMEEHVATCEECYAIWQGDVEFLASEPNEEPSNVVRGRFWRWVSAAVAAGVVIVIVPPALDEYGEYRAMGRFIQSANQAEKRPFDSRLSTDALIYKPPKEHLRSGNVDAEYDEMLRDRAAETVVMDQDADARNRAAAYLYLGKSKEAAKILEAELLSDTDATTIAGAIAKTKDAGILNDLAAAYLDRGENELGLQASARAMQIDPAPLYRFNYALALQQLRRYPEAMAAWNDYLRVDPSSPWKADAEKNLQTCRAFSEPR